MKTLSDYIKPILALIVVVYTYAIFTILIFRFWNDNTIISQVLIAVVSGFTGLMGYYFGYSQGASKKDDVIASQSQQPTASTESGDINLKK